MESSSVFYIFLLIPVVLSENTGEKSSSVPHTSKSSKINARESLEPSKITPRESLESSKVTPREALEHTGTVSHHETVELRYTEEPAENDVDSDWVDQRSSGHGPNSLSLEDFKNAQVVHEEHGHMPSNPNNPSSTCTITYDVKIFKMRGAQWENDHLYWTNNRIPYQISGNFSTKDRAILAKAIHRFENSSCLKFPPKTRDDTHYFTIVHGDECRVKRRTRNESRVIFMNEKCLSPRTVTHVVMHLLGFSHEHTRSDRDKYIDISWNNIAPAMKPYFNVVKNNLLGEPYDYDSIMHVAENYHASNPDQPTIIPKKEGVTIGKTNKLSSGDAAKIKKLFRCS